MPTIPSFSSSSSIIFASISSRVIGSSFFFRVPPGEGSGRQKKRRGMDALQRVVRL
jgi:hypothetical protein